MPVFYARYQLHAGFVHNWLVAGPQAIPIQDLGRFRGEDFKHQIARHYYDPAPGLDQPPVEWGILEIDETPLRWCYYRCPEDHFVDRTDFYPTPHYLRTWAYAEVELPAARDVTCVLTTHGPADVWLNDEHVHRQEHFQQQIPQSVSFPVSLIAGRNRILVRFEAVATRACPYAMAFQFQGLPEDEGTVFLPTANSALARRETLERVFHTAYLDRDVFVREDEIMVQWPIERVPTASLAIRIQTPAGRIYGEAHPNVSPGSRATLGRAYQLPEGQYHLVLMPLPPEYYEENLRIEHRLNLWTVRNEYAAASYGTWEERQLEAMDDAARRYGGIFSEIAKMALGRWDWLKPDVILQTIERINQREDCSDFYLVGLLGMLYRFGEEPAFPETVKKPLEACILNFRYWMDDPGDDAMCFWTENHQILFHTCEVLAGQMFPERTFTNTGQTGAWHRERGERMALSWLRKRGQGGFREWDSNVYFEEDLLALSHLADLALDPTLYELATVVMDKMFFTIALNSFRGVFGSTHGRSYTPHLKSGRLEATSGISRLMWGLGAFNTHIRGTVSLACAESYDLPEIIRQIATFVPEELWSRERHAGELEEWCDRDTGTWEVNKVTYKTPDYMLCSAQDYHPGEPGVQQHIWQATFDQDAVVFVTHPACVSEEGSHRPNFWHGNRVLPRVAQWRDVLVAIHKLPANDWMGFTHAYFPVAAFDEHAIRDGWAFARKGEGYLALTASQGLEFVTRGTNAYRELRSYGQENIWVCQMGRAALDGSFEQFQERVLALDVGLEGTTIHCTTLRGEHLSFGWEGPLLVNGAEQPLKDFKHYDSPFCVADWPAKQMEIQFGDQMMRLNFE